MATTNLQVQLARQSDDVPQASDFKVVQAARPTPGDGQFLVRNIYLSLDPYQRGAIAGRHMGHARLNPGDVIYGRCLGEVMESRHAGYRPGEIVVTESGWQQYFVSDGGAHDQVRKIKPEVQLSAYLGALGMPGLTAWAGVEKLAPPRLGDTFVVSSAAGPVGSTAGQLAKAKGARVVGIAGADTKCRLAVDKFGFDACVNYKASTWLEDLKAACPGGIHVYYDNVNGPMLDAVAAQLALKGRVVLCGFTGLSTPGWKGSNVGLIVGKRAQYLGMVVYDYYGHWDTFLKVATGLVKAGKLAIHEDRAEGLENAPAHFVKLVKGENVGKALVTIAPEKA